MRVVPAGLAAWPGAVLRGLDRAPFTGGEPGRTRRVVQTRPGRAYLSVRGVHLADGEHVARAAERTLAALEGVHWAEVNPILAEVAVAFEDGTVGLDDLAGALDGVEEAHGLFGEEFPADLPDHPADEGPIRRGLVALVADGAGVGIGVAARILRLPRLPIEVASAIPALDSLAPVRRIIEARPGTATAAAMLNAILQGLGQGPLGLVVDATHRLTTVAELTARRRVWLGVEDHLHRGPRAEPLAAAEPEPRPVPLPAGLVDTYGQAASLASLAGGGITLAVTRDLRRTADVLLAGLPRAARLGRDGFAAQVGRGLAARQVVPMDPRVLRRLDQVDTVVVDARTLTTGRVVIGEIRAVGQEDLAPVEKMARALFDPVQPDVARTEDDWALAPVGKVVGTWPRGSRTRARELTAAGFSTLGLSKSGTVVGLVAIQPELHEEAADLAAATQRAGHLLAVAGDRRVAAVLGSDRVVADGEHLASSIRALQAEGRVVALVSTRPGIALRAADCGIGVIAAEEAQPPWGADLLCLHLAEAATIVDVTRLARTASRQAVAVAAAGSAAASLFAISPVPGAGRRAMVVVQLSTLAALGVGTWTGAQLPRRPPRRESTPVAWHALDGAEVVRRLAGGSGGATAEHPATDDNPEDTHRASFPSLLANELTNPLTVILGAGAALSAAVGSIVDAALIAGVLGVDAAVGATQRLRTEAAIGRLASAISEGTVRVLRDGTEVSTSSRSLVVGEVIRLAAGDAVPADCRVLDAVGLETDESSLTGESLPVAKDPKPVEERIPVADRSSMVYAGTAVAAGRGTAVVVATGTSTEARRGFTSATPPPTGVETRLRALTDTTVPIVLGAGAGLALNSLVRGRPPREAVASGVSLAAAAVPEGLPFVATIAQASAAHRLAGRGVLVRNPDVLEALGRVDVLCFDKTGTLTEGRLQLRQVSDGDADEPVAQLGPACRGVLAAALRATPRPRAGGLPHPTDQVIVDGAHLAGVRPGDGAQGWQKAASLPFEPGRAYHAVLGQAQAGPLLSVKGAPEVVIPRCATRRRAPGEHIVLDVSARTSVEAEVERLARQGLRVLAVAERSASDRDDLDDERIDRLELLGFVGVADAARPTASAPIAQLWQAGINVVMITGDHPSTAEAVATDLGLLNGRRVLTGAELDELDDAQLDQVVQDVAVFARVTPADKVRIVSAFQRAGRVVAMTGDGANDAQAIRLADIGVAFGPRATSAARDAAYLIVTPDDVGVLIDTIGEGRAMWASVRDALAILLGGNLGEVAFTAGAALLTGQPPLTPRQLLAVNLFTDLAPAMAIAVQPPRTRRVDLAREGPETSLAGQLARDVIVRASATAAGAYGAWFAARVTGTAGRARTVALAALVGTQLGQTLVIGRRSPLVAGTAVVSAAGLFAMVQTPGISQFFDCRPIGPLGWAIVTAAAGLATASSVAAGALLP